MALSDREPTENELQSIQDLPEQEKNRKTELLKGNATPINSDERGWLFRHCE
ncbi:hypothetical protein RIF25_09250 [Thermosynechococcaceae cyanobacterium BACA0444]|uniref:Uncharacterized protein n=1 Tax=Pseudocalidococcus azoricus BACA0444 TaxID=2918990 RepID=A0AAE4FTE1_9CYAN|nr:hypothetical protein [Pseudocalidococcus azoricus]MDS3860994.1 hypothetical protein [Pseudocalidococcus azoricus BACA0444]